MAEITTTEIKDYLSQIQGQEITLNEIRKEFNILPGSKSFDAIRVIMLRLAEQKIVRPTGRKNGVYKVVVQVEPVQIFGVQRERRPAFPLRFPCDQETGMEMAFAGQVIVREGDLILISGLSNYGKTTLAMNFCGENIDLHPVLMGNEYTGPDGEPMPRFLNRLDAMSWVQWSNGDGMDKFTLLPVRDDYAEHIFRDRINIIDWINIDGEHLWSIGKVLENIKKQIGKGVAIISIQKSENATSGRGGQFTKDFTDLEILLDKFGNYGTLLTLGKVKEWKEDYAGTKAGRAFGFSIVNQGTKIINFREVKRCYKCGGQGRFRNLDCDECEGTGYRDK